MPVTRVSQNIFRETLRNEIPLTIGYEYLSKALPGIGRPLALYIQKSICYERRNCRGTYSQSRGPGDLYCQTLS